MTTTELRTNSTPADDPQSYHLRMATTAAEVLAAAALRHRVFAEEGGAQLPRTDRLDLDEYDVRCDHLIVWYRPTPTATPEAVATYRLLLPNRNYHRPRREGLYTHREFDLAPLEPLLGGTIEAGRACVAAEHRGSPAIALLWSGIARALLESGCRYLIGCAGVPVDDGGGQALLLESMARQRFWAPPEQQCRPRQPIPTRVAGGDIQRLRIPPLLHGYFRLGAVVCGRPSHDPVFGSADFLILLDLHRADPRYLRRFVADAGA